MSTNRQTKRKLVEQLIKQNPKASNVDIAAMAYCTRAYVTHVRNNPCKGVQATMIEAARQRRADAVEFFKKNLHLSADEVCAQFGFGRCILRQAVQEVGFRAIEDFRQHHLLLNEPIAPPPATSLGALLRTRWQQSAVKRALDTVQPVEQEAAA